MPSLFDGDRASRFHRMLACRRNDDKRKPVARRRRVGTQPGVIRGQVRAKADFGISLGSGGLEFMIQVLLVELPELWAAVGKLETGPQPFTDPTGGVNEEQ